MSDHSNNSESSAYLIFFLLQNYFPLFTIVLSATHLCDFNTLCFLTLLTCFTDHTHNPPTNQHIRTHTSFNTDNLRTWLTHPPKTPHVFLHLNLISIAGVCVWDSRCHSAKLCQLLRWCQMWAAGPPPDGSTRSHWRMSPVDVDEIETWATPMSCHFINRPLARAAFMVYAGVPWKTNWEWLNGK